MRENSSLQLPLPSPKPQASPPKLRKGRLYSHSQTHKSVSVKGQGGVKPRKLRNAVAPRKRPRPTVMSPARQGTRDCSSSLLFRKPHLRVQGLRNRDEASAPRLNPRPKGLLCPNHSISHPSASIQPRRGRYAPSAHLSEEG